MAPQKPFKYPFPKICKHVIPSTTSFLHRNMQGKVVGARNGVHCPLKNLCTKLFFGTGHFGALENFCQALSGD